MSEPRGLSSLLTAFGTAGALALGTYAVPGLEAYRPWTPGDPIPVIDALLPRSAPRVVEDERGELVAAPVADAAPPAAADPRAATSGAAAAPGAPAAVSFGGQEVGVPGPTDPAGPGVPTPLVDAEHRGLDRFYRALARVQSGTGLARASHWGDSTIAADGITSTVRARMQARFGDGGPGYLSAGMDPRWNVRKDVSVSRSGEWATKSLLLGGATGARYGFGGIVSTALADAGLVVTAPKRGGKPVPQRRFEVWWQAGPAAAPDQPAPGSYWATVDGRPAGGGSAAADAQGDRWLAVEVPDGFTRASIGATGGPATFYGLVMETAGPGVVWDALGVVGVGSRSFTASGRKHLATQIARRAPDLVVIQLGGNELGLPALAQGDGSGYRPTFTEVVRRLRAGAPEAGCLIITPLDQGTREGGTPRTKPNLPRMVAQQRAVAAAEGCAFWDAFAAMGGEGSMVRWSQTKPALAWSDLLHVSGAGQQIVGGLLADAIEQGFAAWQASGGAARAAPAPAGPLPEVGPLVPTVLGGGTPVTLPAPAAAPAAEPTAAPADAPETAPAASPPAPAASGPAPLEPDATPAPPASAGPPESP